MPLLRNSLLARFELFFFLGHGGNGCPNYSLSIRISRIDGRRRYHFYDSTTSCELRHGTRLEDSADREADPGRYLLVDREWRLR